jgi:hypothetical protein
MLELPKKLQVPAGTAIFLVGAPKGFDPDTQVAKREAGAAVLAFAVDSKALARVKPAIDAANGGRLSWVAYPKAGQLGTDLNRDKLARLMEPFGLEPVRLVSIDDTWSAMRFRPKGYGASR